MVGGLFQAAGDLLGGILSGIGSFEAAAGYSDAADYSKESAELTETSTRIQLAQKQREIYGVLGGQQSDVASSGFLNTAGVLDIVRASGQQGSLSMQLVAHQGLITELGYRAQASAYESQATAAEMQGYGQIAGGVLNAVGDIIGG